MLAIINVELKEKGAVSKEQMHQNHKVPLTQMRLWGEILMSLIYSFSKLGLTFLGFSGKADFNYILVIFLKYIFY